VPEHGTHIPESKLCAGCHSLVTATVDMEGGLTGDEFVEQATWHEWLNSSYEANNTTCQSCHLPTLEGQDIVLAAGFDTPPRQDFGLHTLAGGNTVMLGLMRDNRETLGIYASEQQFNETITATNHQLQDNSLLINVIYEERTEDTLFIDVKLTNKAGHKLPSGYPSRKMSIHFVLLDSEGNEIFRSGGFDDNYYIPEEDEGYEPHHNIITSEEQVQVYEMVMGDVNNEKTTILNRGYTHLKDNRLVPLGFSSLSNVYDTTEVVLGTPDADFNHDPMEGSGTDVIHYHIPVNGFTGAAQVQVEVYYQSLPPTWMEEIFQTSTPQINAFSNMFASADKSPVLMESLTQPVAAYVGTGEYAQVSQVAIHRSLNGSISLIAAQGIGMKVYDLNGNLLQEKQLRTGSNEWAPNVATGTYLLVFTSPNGGLQVEKIIVP
jgi:hypothetical protein